MGLSIFKFRQAILDVGQHRFHLVRGPYHTELHLGDSFWNT